MCKPKSLVSTKDGGFFGRRKLYGPAFAAYASHVGTDYATEESFQDAFCGEWDSEKAYAENLFDELHLHEVPEHVQPYIDYEAYARDLFMTDNISLNNPDGGVFVFYNH